MPPTTPSTRAAAQLLVAELEGPGVVIDLGCGAGDLCEPVRAAGFDYLGVDLSPDMVALAQRRFPDAAFRRDPRSTCRPCAVPQGSWRWARSSTTRLTPGRGQRPGRVAT